MCFVKLNGAFVKNKMDNWVNPEPAKKKRGFDLPLALSRAGGQIDLLQEIAGLFLDDYPGSLAAIENGVLSRDLKAIERAAHSLKGSVCNFGAPEVVFVAAELEQKARAADWSGVPALVATLSEALDQLRVELENVRDRS